MRFHHFLLLLGSLLPLSSQASSSWPATIRRWADWTHIFPSSREVSLLFVGDIMMHTPQLHAAQRAERGYDFDDCFRLIAPWIAEADLAVGNLETTLGGAPYTGYPRFSTPDTLAHTLYRLGFDLLSTTNNHCVDRGAQGLLRTLDRLHEAGIATIGTYRSLQEQQQCHPLLLSRNGVQIAFLSYTYGTNGLPIPPPVAVNLITPNIVDEVAQARANPATHFVVVLLHWGEEYQQRQNKGQRELARVLTRAGADLVIGSHPHVVQGAEAGIPRTPAAPAPLVVYSLGNFVSNQAFDLATRGGLVVGCRLSRDWSGRRSISDVSFRHVWVSRQDGRPTPRYTLYPVSSPDTPAPHGLSPQELLPYSRYQRYAYSLPLTYTSSHDERGGSLLLP